MVLVAITLYAVLPEPLLIGPRFVIPGLELALLVALIATKPWRMTRQTRSSRRASLALAILMVTSNLATLTLLVVDLVTKAFLPDMIDGGYGRIVNMTSVSARQGGGVFVKTPTRPPRRPPSGSPGHWPGNSAPPGSP